MQKLHQFRPYGAATDQALRENRPSPRLDETAKPAVRDP